MKRPFAQNRPLGPFAQRRPNPSLAIRYTISNRSRVPEPRTDLEELKQIEREFKEILATQLDLNRIGLESDKSSRSIIVRLGKFGTSFRQDNLNNAVDSMRVNLENMNMNVEKTEIGIL